MNYKIHYLLYALLSVSTSYAMEDRELRPLTPTQHEDRGWIKIIEIACTTKDCSADISSFFENYLNSHLHIVRHVTLDTTLRQKVNKYMPRDSDSSAEVIIQDLKNYYMVAYYANALKNQEKETKRLIEHLIHFKSQLPGKQE